MTSGSILSTDQFSENVKRLGKTAIRMISEWESKARKAEEEGNEKVAAVYYGNARACFEDALKIDTGKGRMTQTSFYANTVELYQVKTNAPSVSAFLRDCVSAYSAACGRGLSNVYGRWKAVLKLIPLLIELPPENLLEWKAAFEIDVEELRKKESEPEPEKEPEPEAEKKKPEYDDDF